MAGLRDAQTGQLDKSNGRTLDTLNIVSKCEARDAMAVKRLNAPLWQRPFYPRLTADGPVLVLVLVLLGRRCWNRDPGLRGGLHKREPIGATGPLASGREGFSSCGAPRRRFELAWSVDSKGWGI